MATDQALKLYNSGMYGGKFMPMHLGHLYCLKRASKLCETVHLILFYGGKQETDILKHDCRSFLSLDFRIKQIMIAASYFPNVIPKIIDVSECKTWLDRYAYYEEEIQKKRQRIKELEEQLRDKKGIES